MDTVKLPNSTYWFVLGFIRAKMNDDDFKYIELILSEALITESEIVNNLIKNGLKPY